MNEPDGDCSARQEQLSARAMDIAPLQLITPQRFADDRGWFVETYNQAAFTKMGVTDAFVQDNHSLSRAPYTLRGLHFQRMPHAQAKLVRCIRGRIYDVAVDLREGSPTLGRWVGAELSAQAGNQLYIPVGFAHGFVTLEPDCEVVYKCSDFYAPSHDAGVRWDDPDLGIDWPIPAGTTPQLSAKDRELPRLRDLTGHFPYDGRPLGRSA